MKLVKTKDGSFTAFSEIAGEHYHTVSGAIEEAFEKHVNALGIENGMHILDFCFGLGYNSIAACKDHNNLQIIGLENDLKIIEAMKDIEILDILKTEFDAFRNIAENLDVTDNNNNRIQILLGDALQTIDELPGETFDRVFFDPFSPKKQPEMWSEMIFQQIYNKMKNGAKLSTYSCARQIRKNMISAGFEVLDGPVIGRRSPATIAMKR
ncbi:MAG: MnmC family methyltransferase [Candidatus Tenebribacter burtonii]|jgi:tRNA U34 5-methylaminomethyl-2-thiouridine-forming methyltransferase MnmC|nr:MnmC family methyltransferase [Candidatus Tenebribacter burtonii]